MLHRCAIALAVASSASVSASRAENDAINAVYQHLTRAKLENSPEKVAQEYDANATLIDPRSGPPMRGSGLDQSLKSITDRMASEKVRVSTAYRVESRAVLGNVAVDSGYMRTLLTAPAGAPKPKDMYTRFLVTFKRRSDGSWRIIGDASLPADAAAWNNLKRVEGLAFDE
jgi:ketosteroid isomerase-like protein